MNFSKQSDRQILRLERLIDDMLDVSRIRSGKLTIVKEQMDICVATRDVVSRMSAQFSAAGFPVPEVIACESITGNWDLIRIEQVIVNLLTNALRYGEGKQIFVVAEDQNNKAILKVKDQGEGIDVKEHEKIFERFVRSASAKNTGGLGLGLYLTRQIVEAHGGSISLQSTPGQGATFIVELPK